MEDGEPVQQDPILDSCRERLPELNADSLEKLVTMLSKFGANFSDVQLNALVRHYHVLRYTPGIGKEDL